MDWRSSVNRILTSISALAFSFLLGTGVAHAYEVIDVSDGGIISGKITAGGSIPANPQLEISKDPDQCGSSIASDYVLVDSNGGLKNAVVMLEGVAAGKDYEEKAVVTFDNVDCMFSPHVAVAVKGQMLGVNNSDPILHNTHLYQGNNNRTLYNIALPLQDKLVKKPLRRPGKVTVKCDAHEWMIGYLYVSDSPYITVTGEDGAFSIDEVPPGTYKVRIWHEVLGEAISEITVTAGQEAVLEQTLSESS